MTICTQGVRRRQWSVHRPPRGGAGGTVPAESTPASGRLGEVRPQTGRRWPPQRASSARGRRGGGGATAEWQPTGDRGAAPVHGCPPKSAAAPPGSAPTCGCASRHAAGGRRRGIIERQNQGTIGRGGGGWGQIGLFKGYIFSILRAPCPSKTNRGWVISGWARHVPIH